MTVCDPSTNKKIEETITFLVETLSKRGKNPKPVILHSLDVGLYLCNNGYGLTVINAGLLHDILEDTDISPKIIADKFGQDILLIVEAVSYDSFSDDRELRNRKITDKSLSFGQESAIIRAADILQNSYYL